MTTTSKAFLQALFKSTRGGWVYRAPNPWIFGRRTHYLLNDEQKERVAAIPQSQIPALLGLSIAGFLSVYLPLFFGGGWLLGFDFDRTTTELGIFFLAITAGLFAAVSAIAAIQLHRIRPALEGAPITNERITWLEVLEMLSRPEPVRSGFHVGLGVWLLALTGLQVVSLVFRQPRHPLFSDAFSCISALSVLLFAGLAFLHFVKAGRIMGVDPQSQGRQ